MYTFTTAPKFKYRYEIFKTYFHAMKLDKCKGNSKWADATKLELELMDSYNEIENKDPNAAPPERYKTIRFHLIYDVKYDGRCKARLVTDSHLTDLPTGSV